MSGPLATTLLLLPAVSIAHAQNSVPIAPGATDGAVVAQNITK